MVKPHGCVRELKITAPRQQEGSLIHGQARARPVDKRVRVLDDEVVGGKHGGGKGEGQDRGARRVSAGGRGAGLQRVAIVPTEHVREDFNSVSRERGAAHPQELECFLSPPLQPHVIGTFESNDHAVIPHHAVQLRGGLAVWGPVYIAIKLLGGTLALWLCWLAIFQAKRVGINYLLSIFVLVWIADIAAYFAGKAFGRRKLAPSLSPSKSWEGVWGGTCAVWVLAIVWVWADQMAMFDSPSIYSLLYAHGWVYFLVSITFLTAMSVVGDLVESMVKRSAGVKDSSQLLPGHGGVLDRVDALLPTLPLAMMLTQFVI